MAHHARLLSLKRRLFQRDGWTLGYDATNKRQMWQAVCAFPGCDTIIDWDTATMDHYPIPLMLGGSWTMSNLRLACGPCNSADQHPYVNVLGHLMPPGLSNSQKKQWWRQQLAELPSNDSLWGFPIARL